MKKHLICLLLALTLSGCNLSVGNTPSTTAPDNGEQDTTTGYTGDEAYKSIVSRDVEDFEKKTFAIEGSEYQLTFRLPYDWRPYKNTDSDYTILNSGVDIGHLFLGEATDLDDWKSVSEKEVTYKGLSIKEHIEKTGSGYAARFRYRFVYSYVDRHGARCMTLTADYAEVGENIEYELYGCVSLNRTDSYTQFSKLSDLQNGRLLILGNAFLGTSYVGNALSQMLTLNKKDATVSWYWRSGATAETYLNNEPSILYQIREGKYDAIFLCGCYTADVLESIGALADICNQAGTQLILFPAHNETKAIIDAASSQYRLSVLNWKEEINALIDNGVKQSDMCINDDEKHSTKIAGYVGAHMIYRAIFGETPFPNLDAPFDQEKINNILGDYVSSGNTNPIDYYLK